MNPTQFFTRLPNQGTQVLITGDVYTYLATGDETGGAYALMHALVPPGGGPPPHKHSREEEQFYVLEGEVTFVCDGRKLVAGAGSCLHLPKGSLHAFKNEGSKPARMLIQVMPAGLEKMFLECGRVVEGAAAVPTPPTPADIAKLLAAAPKYGIEIAGPPH